MFVHCNILVVKLGDDHEKECIFKWVLAVAETVMNKYIYYNITYNWNPSETELSWYSSSNSLSLYLGSVWLFEDHIGLCALSNITLLQYFFQLLTKQTQLSVTTLTCIETGQKMGVKLWKDSRFLQLSFIFHTKSNTAMKNCPVFVLVDVMYSGAIKEGQ